MAEGDDVVPALLTVLPTWARLMEGGGVTAAHFWSPEDSVTPHIFWRLLGADDDVDMGCDDGVTPAATTADDTDDFFITSTILFWIVVFWNMHINVQHKFGVRWRARANQKSHVIWPTCNVKHSAQKVDAAGGRESKEQTYGC